MSESRAELREYIQEYLEIKKNLNMAAARVVYERKYHTMDEIAKHFEVSNEILKIKVNILNQMYDYDKKRDAYETAVGSVLHNMRTVEHAATEYKLKPETVNREYQRYLYLRSEKVINEPYIYDKCLDEERIFLFREELSLMVELRQWKYKSPSCTCLICAIEVLSSLAYHFAKKKNKLYPSSWNNNMRTDKLWLIKFVMAHDCRLLKLYPNYKDNVQELLETCKNKI